MLLWCKTTFTTLLQNLTTHSFGLKKGLTNVTETKKVHKSKADSINIKHEQKLNYSQYSGYASSVIEASKGGRVARGHQVSYDILHNNIYDTNGSPLAPAPARGSSPSSPLLFCCPVSDLCLFTGSVAWDHRATRITVRKRGRNLKLKTLSSIVSRFLSKQ